MKLPACIGLSRGETLLSRNRLARGAEWGGVGGEGFTFLEVVIVVALLLMLVIAGLSALTILDRSARRQAHYTTAMELAQGRLDEVLATKYNPPLPPFSSTNHVKRESVTLTVDREGKVTATAGVLTTTLEPALNGHVATVVVEFTNFNQPAAVKLQTLVNHLSGGQP